MDQEISVCSTDEESEESSESDNDMQLPSRPKRSLPLSVLSRVSHSPKSVTCFLFILNISIVTFTFGYSIHNVMVMHQQLLITMTSARVLSCRSRFIWVSDGRH